MAGKLTFVSAGAGSGKTYRLANILYDELQGGRARPSGVIATTFTRKAAAELRERVRTSLLERGAFGLATAIGQARMGTVNSVCGQLLERFAFEAGLATEQRVLEDDQADALIREASDATVDAATFDSINQVAGRLGVVRWQQHLKALVTQARANDIGPERIAGFAQANAADLLSHFASPTHTDLDAALQTAIEEAIPALRETVANDGRKKTSEYLTLVDDVRRGLDGGSLPWSAWVKLSKAAPEKALRPLVERVTGLSGRYAEHPRLHEDVRGYLDHLFRVCARVLEVYAARKRDMGAMDFTDQEHLLLKILDQPEVAAALRDELDLLLVDEFQDTSPIQLALFVRLTALAKQTFWVGDVKQAIYGFRGSDTALMQAVLATLPALGGQKELLQYSWRSRPSLVELVNSVFTPAFAGSLPEGDVRLNPKRGEVGDSHVLSNWILGGKNRAAQGTALAIGVRDLLASGYVIHCKATDTERRVRRGDIAILARTNDHVREIAAALTVHGIPAATAQPGLLRRPEAVLALACLRRLNDANDTIATAEILALADCQQPEEWLDNRLRHLAAGGDPARWREAGPDVHPLLARLASMRSQLPLLAPHEALQLVLTQCELPARVLRWCPDEASARVRLANLENLAQLASDYEERCEGERTAGTISGLISWLAAQGSAGDDALAEPAIDAVRVLTHHGAKGLEWPVVILTDLETEIRDNLWGATVGSPAALDVTDPLRDRFIRFWPWPFGKQQKVPLAEELATKPVAIQFRDAAIEEAKRLLYVSMTRARDLLVLARRAKRPSGRWIDVLDSPGLLPDETATTIPVPGGGTVRCEYRVLEPPESTDSGAPVSQQLYWYPSVPDRTERPPLFVSPSEALPVACTAGVPVTIGSRVVLERGIDVTALGIGIHACLAASFADRSAPLSVAEVDRIVAALGLAGHVPADAVHAQLGALGAWIDARWPSCRAMSEVPVEHVLHNGQVLRGQADLLLQTDAGWILIDHKSNPGALCDAPELARTYSGQLHAYAEAIVAATGRPVAETWLYLPVAGGAIQVTF